MAVDLFDDILGGEAPPAPIGHNAGPALDERSEKAIQNDALVALWQIPHSFWWRENTGQAWQGRKVRHDQDVLVLADARPVKFGLTGIADIMGSAQGIPVAVEMKDAAGRQRVAQRNFERAWVNAGGIYILARTVAQAVDGVRRALASRLALAA